MQKRATPARRRLVPLQAGAIEHRILFIRAQRVLLDRDLAVMYGVETKVLNQAMTRNAERFPKDFAFHLTPREIANLRSQIVTSSSYGGTRYRPRVFTEQGVAMLSSVLRSTRAIAVNIAIMRAFVRLRRLLATHKDLARRLDELEERCDGRFTAVFDAIRRLMSPERAEEPPRRRIGFTGRA
jgi:hypothetical protein